MKQLREFAQRKADFDKLNTEVVGISVDDLAHSQKVHDEITHGTIPILSDPGAKVIWKYGLLHAHGRDGKDIAIRGTVLIDTKGNEVFRRVSESVIDVPKADEILNRIKSSQ